MISVDSNILLYAHDTTCPEHEAARGFIRGHAADGDFTLCELVLVEFYVLLRNPTVLKSPLSAREAVAAIQVYRSNPHWRIVESAPGTMGDVWRAAEAADFPRRRIFDARLAYTLLRHNVTRFATRNVGDFKSFGFQKVWDPITGAE